MELAYLKKLYQDGLFDVYSGFDTWEEAVKAACWPLIRQGRSDAGVHAGRPPGQREGDVACRA